MFGQLHWRTRVPSGYGTLPSLPSQAKTLPALILIASADVTLKFMRARLVHNYARATWYSIIAMSTTGAPTSPAVVERDLKLLAAMEKFATAPDCRRKALLGYFGEDMGETDTGLDFFGEGGKWPGKSYFYSSVHRSGRF